MKTKLITALRLAAKALEDGTFNYKWVNPSNCNCGVLACAITGYSSNALDSKLPKIENPTWKTMVGEHCPLTGMPTHEVFAALFDSGLTAKDIVELEVLSNPDIRARVGNRFITKLGWFGRKRKIKVEWEPCWWRKDGWTDVRNRHWSHNQYEHTNPEPGAVAGGGMVQRNVWLWPH